MDYIGTLCFDQARVDAANKPGSPAAVILQKGLLSDLKNHFNLSVSHVLICHQVGTILSTIHFQKKSGCRCIIDQYVLAAVLYAQSTISSDRALKKSLDSRYRTNDPHIAVFFGATDSPHQRDLQ